MQEDLLPIECDYQALEKQYISAALLNACNILMRNFLKCETMIYMYLSRKSTPQTEVGHEIRAVCFDTSWSSVQCRNL